MSAVAQQPKVAILLPNKDRYDLLMPCVESVLRLTTYSNYEIVIVDNGSTDSNTLKYYEELTAAPSKVRILRYPDTRFDYQRIINFAVENCEGDYIVQLNNDTVMLTPNWIELMLEVLAQEDAGLVGAMLYHPDMSLQLACGTIYMHKTGMVCEGVFPRLPKDEQDKIGLLSQVRPVAYVCSACSMMRKSLFEQIGGMDEAYQPHYGDIDLCMKVRAHGKHNYVHPLVKVIHYVSASRDIHITAEEIRKEKTAERYFINKWQDMIQEKDPYDINDDYRVERGYLFTLKKILYKLLPLSIYVHFHRLGALINESRKDA